jgi:putative colanic acid biosynthesis glycosyltransferase WcaI
MRILVNDFAGHPFQIQLSRALAGDGHVIRHTYFGANNTPRGRVFSDNQNLKISNLTIEREFKKHSVFSRRNTDIAYGRALGNVIQEFRPDIVISANTPLDAQRVALAATREVKGKFIFWLQDLLSTGIEFVLRKKHIPFARMLGQHYRRMECALLRKSDAVVCIATEFKILLDKWLVGSKRTFVIENWASLDEVKPISELNAWAREQDIEGKFCYMYSGTLGMKHKPELILELARRYESRQDVVIVVIAQGKGAEWLRANSNKRDASVLRFLPFQPYERLSEVLSSAHVLISLLDEDCGEFAVPSKTLTYLCAGRPILIASPLNNLAARIVMRAGAGVAVRPTVEEFLAGASSLMEDGETRRMCGVRARKYAEQTFNIERIKRDFLQVFESVAS